MKKIKIYCHDSFGNVDYYTMKLVYESGHSVDLDSGVKEDIEKKARAIIRWVNSPGKVALEKD
jgi:hypothetical protein